MDAINLGQAEKNNRRHRHLAITQQSVRAEINGNLKMSPNCRSPGDFGVVIYTIFTLNVN